VRGRYKPACLYHELKNISFKQQGFVMEIYSFLWGIHWFLKFWDELHASSTRRSDQEHGNSSKGNEISEFGSIGQKSYFHFLVPLMLLAVKAVGMLDQYQPKWNSLASCSFRQSFTGASYKQQAAKWKKTKRFNLHIQKRETKSMDL
jgi:hypothetical protein